MKLKTLSIISAITLILAQIPLVLSVAEGLESGDAAVIAESFESMTTNEEAADFWDQKVLDPSEGTMTIALSQDGGSRNSKSVKVSPKLYYTWSDASFAKTVSKQEDGIAFRMDLRSISAGADAAVQIGLLQGDTFEPCMFNGDMATGVYYPYVFWNDVGDSIDLNQEFSLVLIIKSKYAHAGDGMAYADNIVMYLDDLMYIRSVTNADVQAVAEGITGITDPAQDATRLIWPIVKTGYQISIKSSSRPDVINLNGEIFANSYDIPVKLVFTVAAAGCNSVDTAPLTVTVPKSDTRIANLTYDNFNAYIGDGDVSTYLSRGYSNPTSITTTQTLSQNQGTDGSKAFCLYHSGIASYGALQMMRNNIPVKEDGTQFSFKTEKETRISIKVLVDGTMKGYFRLNGVEMNGMTLAPGTYYPNVWWQDVGVSSGSVTIQWHFIAPTTKSLQANNLYIDDLIYVSKNAVDNIQYIAKGVIEAPAPAEDQVILENPKVPLGFRIAIKSSSNPSVIGLNGAITPTKRNTPVNLVFTVTAPGGSTADSDPVQVTVPLSPAEVAKFTYENFESMAGDETVQDYLTRGYSSPSSITHNLFLSADKGVNGSKALGFNHSNIASYGSIQMSRPGITVKENGMQFCFTTESSTRLSIKVIQDGISKGYFKIGGSNVQSMTLSAGTYYPYVKWSDLEVVATTITLQFQFEAPTTASLSANTIYLDNIVYTASDDKTISWGNINNGSVVVSNVLPVAGDSITVTVNPRTGYQLKAGSLAWVGSDGTSHRIVNAISKGGSGNEFTFNMPDDNVNVTAEYIPESQWNMATLGAQCRINPNDASGFGHGLRFGARLYISSNQSPVVRAEIGGVEQDVTVIGVGMLLLPTAYIPADIQLAHGIATVGNRTILDVPAVNYYDKTGCYYDYTAQIVNMNATVQNLEITARPYVKYKMESGSIGYLYSEEISRTESILFAQINAG